MTWFTWDLLLGYGIAIFITGMMVGHRFLPAPIDTKKEELIDALFRDNMRLRLLQEEPLENPLKPQQGAAHD